LALVVGACDPAGETGRQCATTSMVDGMTRYLVVAGCARVFEKSPAQLSLFDFDFSKMKEAAN
jgi:hypothetical protein